MRNTLHKVLLKKLDKVYRTLMEFTVDLANNISQMVKDIKSNKMGKVSKKSRDIHSIVSGKVGVLRSFAYKYTYNLIHSDKFYDLNNNKIVLITKKAHSM